jgi:hypothetical protein
MFVQTINPFGETTIKAKKGNTIILIGLCLFGLVIVYKFIVWQNQVNSVADNSIDFIIE